MKKLKFAVLLLLLAAISTETYATKYIIIQRRFSGNFELIDVPKPNDLKKWYHDSKNDIYYRAKNGFGIRVRISSKNRTSK
jgi:hypothetical protein